VDKTGSRLGYDQDEMQLPRMLLGADFLKAHRLLIAPSHDLVLFTYTGGPVFDVDTPSNRIPEASSSQTPSSQAPASQAPASPAPASKGPTSQAPTPATSPP
jgi:hypothetical protein